MRRRTGRMSGGLEVAPAAFAALVLATAAPAQGPAPAPADAAGRWDLTVQGPEERGAGWLELRREGGGLAGRLQWIYGHATPVAEAVQEGARLRFLWPVENNPQAPPARAEGEVAAGSPDRIRLTLTQPNGAVWRLEGRRAPSLTRAPADTAGWGAPIDLLAGGLAGWTASGPGSNWTVADGVLENAARGSNLVSKLAFRDFKLTLEVRVPAGGNSGIYLRGRHEVQVQDSYGKPAGSREMGGIYGQLTPLANAAGRPGEWQRYEITFVGRRVRAALNGVLIHDFAEIPGVTGGALDADEGAPGPLYLQGDHGPVAYRDILVTPAMPDDGPALAGLRERELRRFEAMTRGDTAALAPLLADDLVYTHSNALVETKESHLAAIASRSTVYRALVPTFMDWRRHGDLALGAGMVYAAGFLRGTPFDVALRVSTVHRLRGGRWELLSWQSTRVP